MSGVLFLQDCGLSSEMTIQRQTAALLATNEMTGAYGLILTTEDVKRIMQVRAESLHDNARVEFGEGIAAKLVLAFADSPYLTQDNYADTIAALLILFDTFKNELRDAYNDRELLTFMRNAFDGECAGSLELLETEAFPRLLTSDTSIGCRTVAEAQYALHEKPVTSAVELTREQLRRQHQLEDQEADGRVYDTNPEVWEDENGRQVMD